MKTEDILNSLRTNEFVLNSQIPMGYTPGLPMLSLQNGEPCLVIPYMKYQMTGTVDQTRVFPPRFVITVAVTKGTIVKYEDLAYDSHFEEVDFQKAVGLFRHASIRHLKKTEYTKMRQELYGLLDELASSMAGNIDFDDMDAMKLSRLFTLLLEPSVRPFYHAINKTFFETYIH